MLKAVVKIDNLIRCVRFDLDKIGPVVKCIVHIVLVQRQFAVLDLCRFTRCIPIRLYRPRHRHEFGESAVVSHAFEVSILFRMRNLVEASCNRLFKGGESLLRPSLPRKRTREIVVPDGRFRTTPHALASDRLECFHSLCDVFVAPVLCFVQLKELFFIVRHVRHRDARIRAKPFLPQRGQRFGRVGNCVDVCFGGGDRTGEQCIYVGEYGQQSCGKLLAWRDSSGQNRLRIPNLYEPFSPCRHQRDGLVGIWMAGELEGVRHPQVLQTGRRQLSLGKHPGRLCVIVAS